MNIGRVNSLEPVSNVSTSDGSKIKKSDICGDSNSIVLSQRAREAAVVKMAISVAISAPEIRFDKVEMARKNINDPVYFERVIEETAEKIMESFGF